MQVIWKGKQGKTEGALSGERGKVKIGVCILTLRRSALLCHLEKGKATLFEIATENHVLHLPKTTHGFVYIALGVMMLPPPVSYRLTKSSVPDLRNLLSSCWSGSPSDSTM